jgi:exopolyphosphatase/guanosine-5'-triphosphate,3'-diphosphate pyrophosphatase
MGRLARLLRLAVLLNHARPEQPPAVPALRAEGEALHLRHAAAEDPSLLHTDLEQEAEYQATAGFTLTLA